MLVIAALLLVSLALLVLGMIAETRWMGLSFVTLAMVVCFVTATRFAEDHSAWNAIWGFMIIISAISHLIAIPVWRRRVVPPRICVRDPESKFPVIIGLIVMIAFVAFGLVTGSFHRNSDILGSWAVFIVVYIPPLLGKTEICGNGVWQRGRLHRWENYASFSWDRKTDESIELRLMSRSPTWERDPKRLIVLPEDREAVVQVLEANLPEVSA